MHECLGKVYLEHLLVVEVCVKRPPAKCLQNIGLDVISVLQAKLPLCMGLLPQG